MRYFKLFEQFINNRITEASKAYTLEDYIDDNDDRDLKTTAEMIAVLLKLKPSDIAIVTNEDDDFDVYHERYKDSKSTPLRNPASEMSTYHLKDEHVVFFNDGSAMGYFIPVKML